MNAIYKFFKSTRLAIVLILVIILFALLSTLIPQGKTAEEYKAMYSPVIYSLVMASDLQNYTGSLLFIVPMILFVLNLGTCTISRLVTRAKNKAVKHFGPDLIHIGLLVLVVGALITTALRKEQDFTMGPGDAVNLSSGYSMTLTNFEFLKYPDGRPKAWISTVDVSKGDSVVYKGFKIEVNHPLVIGNLKIYQTSYAEEGLVDLVDAAGNAGAMKIGQGIHVGDSELWFSGTRQADNPAEGLVAQFQEYKGQAFVAIHEVVHGQRLGDYTVSRVTSREVTGLRAASDPGFIPVLIALIICGIGLTLTSVHKSKGDI